MTSASGVDPSSVAGHTPIATWRRRSASERLGGEVRDTRVDAAIAQSEAMPVRAAMRRRASSLCLVSWVAVVRMPACGIASTSAWNAGRVRATSSGSQPSSQAATKAWCRWNSRSSRPSADTGPVSCWNRVTASPAAAVQRTCPVSSASRWVHNRSGTVPRPTSRRAMRTAAATVSRSASVDSPVCGST